MRTFNLWETARFRSGTGPAGAARESVTMSGGTSVSPSRARARRSASLPGSASSSLWPAAYRSASCAAVR
jgi:hypothetical protein